MFVFGLNQPQYMTLSQCGGRPLCNCDGMDTGNRTNQLSEQQGLHSLNLRQGGMRKSFWLQASKHTRWCTTISDSATINMPELECCCMSSIIWQPFTSPPRLPLLEMSRQIFVEKPCNIVNLTRLCAACVWSVPTCIVADRFDHHCQFCGFLLALASPHGEASWLQDLQGHYPEEQKGMHSRQSFRCSKLVALLVWDCSLSKSEVHDRAGRLASRDVWKSLKWFQTWDDLATWW